MKRHGRLGETGSELGTYEGHSGGLERRVLVDRTRGGSPHQEIVVAELRPGGSVDLHLHAFEQAFYVLAGRPTLTVAGVTEELGPDDYVFIDRGVAHALANHTDDAASWFEVSAPQPGADLADTVFPDGEPPLAPADPPYWRGHFDPASLPEPTKTGIGLAGFSQANVGGASLEILVGPAKGASQLTLMVVQYVPGGFIGRHDHAFEEGFFFVEGEIDAQLEDETTTLRAGDFCWSGVESMHALRNTSDRPVRWLETQVPQPPSRYQARFVADWEAFVG